MKRKRHFRRTAWGLLLLAAALAVQAEEQAGRKPLVVGEIVSFRSGVLSEERTIQVYRPQEYGKSALRYPVLYLLDGDRNFLHAAGIVQLLSVLKFMPEMIVVAVLNTDRDRDFTPTSVDGYPEVAGAASFLSFLENELVPFIEQSYRTTPFRILFGHSLSGLFAAYAFCSKPELFAATILTSPSLNWDHKRELAQMSTFLKGHRSTRGFLYLAVAAEDDRPTLKACDELARLLEKNAPPMLHWRYEVVRGESHGSVAHPVLWHALKAIYSGWRIPNSRLARMSLAQVREHYLRLAQEFGDVRSAQEVSMSELGYILLERKEYTQAIEAFLANVESSPQSEYRNSELGYAYERAGDLAAAIRYYETAVQMARANGAQGLPGYEADLRRVQNKMVAPAAKKE